MVQTKYGDRVVLVTGGASGMGLASARRWVAGGGRVVIGDLDERGLAQASTELGTACVTQYCDVTREADQQALAALALHAFGRLDCAIAGPAMGGSSAIVNMDVDEWRRIVDITLTGVMITIKHAARVMSDGGAIATIASVNALQPGLGVSAYNAAKAGVVMLSQIAAMELGHRGIRVNSVCPGLIETPMPQAMFSHAGMMADWYENTPLRRHGQPDEVAAVICWLCSQEASFVTGESITVDGGIQTMRYPNVLKHFGIPLDAQ